ncbi:MAG TPA: cytochrome P450 [Kofleriaceae bacterium]|nr:cytochrome P450 [Kofleriaceae bacterium]
MDPAIDLTDPDSYAGGIPHDVFRWLRAHDPVSWRATGYWAVTRHADVTAVLRAPTVFSSWRGGVLVEDPPPEFLAKLRQNVLNRDPPDHTAMRRLLNHAFSPKQIAVLEDRIAAYARELVGRVREQSGCDFATEVAGEMPLFVICEILGVPHEDRQALYALTARMFGSELPDRAAALRDGMAAAEQMRAYGAELERAKRAAPADDLVSELLGAEIAGRRLEHDEFLALFMLLFNAGADTTRSLMCYGLDLLLEHPEALARLRADEALLAPAIEEMLRYEPPVIQVRRTATRDVELAGRRIAEGDKVIVYLPSANRDEAVFPEPDRFDVARSPNHHLAFGHGVHFCLGAPLARLEIKHVLRQVLAQLDELERAAPLVTSRTSFIRSARHQALRFRARRAAPA